MKQQDSKKIVVRLLPGVDAEPLYRGQLPGSNVDCRLLLLGDRHRQLLRAYTELVYRMSRPGDLKAIAAEVLESAEIQQYYDVSLANGYVGLTLRDGIFQEQYPLHSDDFVLRTTAGSRVMTVPLPLERFRALGTLLPLLAGDKGDSEIALGLEGTLEQDEQEWSRDLLAKLHAQGFLQRGLMRSNSFLLSPVRPRVTFVGHTSILLQTAGATVLTDPLLRNLLKSPSRAF